MTEQPKFKAGANALTNVLGSMMRGIADKPPAIDFGVVNGDYSLMINSFPRPIPKEEYSVCRTLMYSPKVPLTETYLACTNCPHSHLVKLPKKMYHLRPGDKVLVAIIQNELVVIDIVYNASWLPGEPPWR